MKKRKAQVVIFFLDEQRKKQFLLLRTNKKRGEYWQNVTGSVNAEESYKQGALREAIEETGLREKNIKKIHKTECNYQFHDRWGRDVKEKLYVIHAKSEWEVKIDPSEHCDYKWVGEKDIKPRMLKHICNYLSLAYAIHCEDI